MLISCLNLLSGAQAAFQCNYGSFRSFYASQKAFLNRLTVDLDLVQLVDNPKDAGYFHTRLCGLCLVAQKPASIFGWKVDRGVLCFVKCRWNSVHGHKFSLQARHISLENLKSTKEMFVRIWIRQQTCVQLFVFIVLLSLHFELMCSACFSQIPFDLFHKQARDSIISLFSTF